MKLPYGYDEVESKPRVRETSGLAVKHVPRETSSFDIFPRGTLFANIYRLSVRRTVVIDILTKVSACGIINISRETKTSYTIRRTVIDRNPKMWYNKRIGSNQAAINPQ